MKGAYIDTEFTDFLNPVLISVGIATSDGSELYVELREGEPDGWSRHACSEFVRAAVLPQLEPTGALPSAEAAARIREYLERLVESGGGQLEVVVDYSVDGMLVGELLGEPVPGVRWVLQQLGGLGELVAERELSKSRRHHALDDARALRAGAMAEARAARGAEGQGGA